MTIADEIRAKAYTAERMTVEQVCYNEGIEDAARIAEAGEAKLREELAQERQDHADDVASLNMVRAKLARAQELAASKMANERAREIVKGLLMEVRNPKDRTIIALAQRFIEETP